MEGNKYIIKNVSLIGDNLGEEKGKFVDKDNSEEFIKDFCDS